MLYLSMQIEQGAEPRKEPTDCDRAYALIAAGFDSAESYWKAIIKTLDLIYENEDQIVSENTRNFVKRFLKRYVESAVLVEKEPPYRRVTLKGLEKDNSLTELSEGQNVLVDQWVEEFAE